MVVVCTFLWATLSSPKPLNGSKEKKSMTTRKLGHTIQTLPRFFTHTRVLDTQDSHTKQSFITRIYYPQIATL